MKYYFLCPWYVTGGPEAIHQACSEMNNLGYDAYIVYDNNSTTIMPNYIKYNVKACLPPEDDEKNVIIIPESYQPICSNLYKKSKLAYYWLSKDFAVNISKIADHQCFTNMEWHLCQSKYVFDYLINDLKLNKDKVIMVTDFTVDLFIESEEFLLKTFLNKKNIVLYNPRKGFEYSRSIIEYCSSLPIEFIGINDMTPEKIKQLAQLSKCYIDFGHHPGKDRLPREMCISGCSIIVGNVGSASVYEDVPIESYRKIDINNFFENLVNIKNLIINDLENYENSFNELLNYRNIIRNEKQIFTNEISNFRKVTNQ